MYSQRTCGYLEVTYMKLHKIPVLPIGKDYVKILDTFTDFGNAYDYALDLREDGEIWPVIYKKPEGNRMTYLISEGNPGMYAD